MGKKRKSVWNHRARELQPSPLLLGFCVHTTTLNSLEHLPHSNCTPFSGSISHSHHEAGPETKGWLGAGSGREMIWVSLHAPTPACRTAPAQAFPQVSAIPLLPSTINPKSIAADTGIYGNHVSNCHSITFSGTLTQFLQGWYSSYHCCPKAPCCRVGQRAAWGAEAAGITAFLRGRHLSRQN